MKIRVCGGEPGPAQALGSKLGPLGLQAKKVNEDIIKLGKEWKGIRVPIHLHCQDRAAKVLIKPTASALIIKDMGNFQRDRKKQKLVNRSGNVTFQQIKNIAKAMEAHRAQRRKLPIRRALSSQRPGNGGCSGCRRQAVSRRCPVKCSSLACGALSPHHGPGRRSQC